MNVAQAIAEGHDFYYELRRLRDAVLDFERGVITLAELVELATGRRP